MSTIKDLFLAVADLPDAAAQRAGLQELGATPEQRERVLAMCERERRGTPTHFSAPVAAALGQLAASELQASDTLGPWRLTAELGAGGMGRVFAAERADGLYQQRAAIKLLRGQAPPELLARERQILATLEHPHIARLLDGGTTPAGRPYLVMAFIDGQPLDAWAASATVAHKLALLGQIGAALDFAHRHLVVHCDLKPANVFVTAEGHAVLLDFGIARLEQADGDDAAAGLTPRYASPEQLAGRPLSSATDVYSLGRLTEELLEGAPRETEWRAIVARACAPDPAERYPSALALVDDLQRWQQHRPLRALPRRRTYVLAKALRRHWPWALAGSAAVLMAAGFTWQLVQSRDRALAAEQRAEAEAAAARQVSHFLSSLFEDADPRQARRPDLPATALLDRGRERLTRDLAGQPTLQAELQRVLGLAYENLGQPKAADGLYEAAAQLAAQQGRPDLEALALGRLAILRTNEHRDSEAEAAARRALALETRLHAPDSLALADARNNLGVVLSNAGRFDEARELQLQALATRRAHGPDGEAVASSLHNLGFLEHRAGRGEASLPHYREALALKTRLLGEGHLSTVRTLANLGTALMDLQRLGEALPVLERALVLTERVHGADSSQTAELLNEHGLALLDNGQSRDAVRQLRRAVALRATEGDSLPLAVNLNNLAHALLENGDTADALAAYQRSLQLREKLGAAALSQARARHNLGRALLRTGQVAAARPLLQAAAQARAGLPLTHQDRQESVLWLAELDLQAPLPADLKPAHQRLLALTERQRARRAADAAQALTHWRAAVAALQTLPPTHPARLAAELDLADALARSGATDEARSLRQTVRGQLSSYGERAPLRIRVSTESKA